MVQGTVDVSQVAQIAIWFLFVVEVFSVGAGLGTKYALLRKFAGDDWLMLMALVCICDLWRLSSTPLNFFRPCLLPNASRYH